MSPVITPLHVVHVDDVTEDLQVTELLLGSDPRWKYQNMVRSWEAVDAIPAMDPAPDVVMVDINMPNMDGRTLVADLQQHASLKDTTFIVVSSSEDYRDLEAFRAFGVELFVHKAFNLKTYCEALTSALEQCLA